MKRTGLGHPKIKRLAGLLGISEAHAVGICEMLWHSTGRYAIRGDIGKWSDAEIAVFAGWPADDAERLIQALLKSRLIDPHANHRYVIHDWHDHADDMTKKTLKRKGWMFASLEPETFREESGLVQTLAGDVQTCPDNVQTSLDSQSQSQSQSQSHKPEPKSSCPTLRLDEEDRSLASWVWELIQAMQPDRKAPNLERWANDIRLMREQDGRTEAEIRELFAWVNSDEFWRTNVLSPSKLRAKWDDLKLRKDRPNGKQERNLVGAGQQYDPDAAAKDPDHGKW